MFFVGNIQKGSPRRVSWQILEIILCELCSHEKSIKHSNLKQNMKKICFNSTKIL